MNQASPKRDKFVKLAVGRTQLALDAIQKLSNLSNKSAYSWEKKDISKIAKSLRDAITEMERSFDPKSDKKATFDLDD